MQRNIFTKVKNMKLPQKLTVGKINATIKKFSHQDDFEDVFQVGATLNNCYCRCSFVKVLCRAKFPFSSCFTGHQRTVKGLEKTTWAPETK